MIFEPEQAVSAFMSQASEFTQFRRLRANVAEATSETGREFRLDAHACISNIVEAAGRSRRRTVAAELSARVALVDFSNCLARGADPSRTEAARARLLLEIGRLEAAARKA